MNIPAAITLGDIFNGIFTIDTVLHHGKIGEVYNIGGNNEKPNNEIVKLIISTLGKSENLIRYVKDRRSRDKRYAIDNTKITTELGWKPKYTFEQGMKETIEWYVQISQREPHRHG